MAAEQFMLRVTAGPSYDPATHVVLPVNTAQSTLIASEHCTTHLQVRIKNYRGLPRGSPTTSPYFSHPQHTSTQYSIAFAFTPHASVSGTDLTFGNDFDRPIRDRLPPGFGTAFRIVRWAIDPGLDGDPYADNPWLYGPLLSSVNALHVGAKTEKAGAGDSRQGEKWKVDALGEEVIEEGAGGGAQQLRDESGVPDGAAERQKWALHAPAKEGWTWEAGRVYKNDFFNGYLDFNDFSLRLPGFHLHVLPHLSSKEPQRRYHDLRYVLKNKATGDVFFVVVFTLIMKEDVDKAEREAKAKEASKESVPLLNGSGKGGAVQTSADDLD